MRAPWIVAAAAVSAGCLAEDRAPPAPVIPPDVPFELTPGEPVLHRLTADQYRNSVRDLLGEVVVAGPLEPDEPLAGLRAVGAGHTTISAWGVEQYESLAFDLAQQALAAPEGRARLIPCTPATPTDLECARAFVEQLGRRVFRRPLDPELALALARTATTAAGALDSFEAGLEIALGAMLQSPRFLFRVEIGEPDPARPGARRYDGFELASRLSYFLWNTTPDDALLDAAERGELSTEQGLAAQVDRMLAAPQLRAGVRALFTDLFHLYRLDQLVKDPQLFPHFSDQVGPAAREETLRMIERIAIDEDRDFRDLLIEERTVVDRRLAAIYNVRASAREGFGEVILSREGLRRGLIGQVSFLALQSHAVSSSATLRGKFIRQVLLCGEIPPPPVNVNTALPEPSGDTLTLRDRVREHLTNEGCRGCHLRMDPIGLGLESFDGLGRFRRTENGGMIDPSSDLDGTTYADPWDLAGGLRDHPDLPRCTVRNAYRYATGNVEGPGEGGQLEDLERKFARSGYRLKALLKQIALSPGFVLAQEVTP